MEQIEIAEENCSFDGKHLVESPALFGSTALARTFSTGMCHPRHTIFLRVTATPTNAPAAKSEQAGGRGNDHIPLKSRRCNIVSLIDRLGSSGAHCFECRLGLNATSRPTSTAAWSNYARTYWPSYAATTSANI